MCLPTPLALSQRNRTGNTAGCSVGPEEGTRARECDVCPDCSQLQTKAKLNCSIAEQKENSPQPIDNNQQSRVQDDEPKDPPPPVFRPRAL